MIASTAIAHDTFCVRNDYSLPSILMAALRRMRLYGLLIVALLVAGSHGANAQTAHYLLEPSVVSMGSTTVQGIPTTALVTFVFDTSGTLGSVVATTQGAQGSAHLDFQAQLSLPCLPGSFFLPGGVCAVLVTFTPYAPGLRTGAVQLVNSSGTVFATAYLSGIGVAGQASFPPGTKSVLTSGLNEPQHVAVDATGNVFVADSQNHRVVKIPWNGASYGTQTTVGTGLQTPWGVAIDGGGNVFISDSSANKVIKVPWTGSAYGTQINLPFNGLSTPQGIALDVSGNVFVADKLNNRVLELPWNGVGYGTQTSIGTVNQPYGLALDAIGDVYVAAPLDFAIKEIPWTGLAYGAVTTFAPYSGGALDVAIDGNGNLYLADPTSLMIERFPWTGLTFGTATTLGAALAGPEGIAVDAQGNLYVGENNNNDVVKLDVVTPPTLSFTSTPAGTTSSDSPLTVTLFNMGNAPLIFPIPSLGTDPSVTANFYLNNASTCPTLTIASLSVGSLGIGASCTIAASFTPSLSATGSLTGSLTIVDNSLQFLGVSHTISLSGTVQTAQTINFTAPTSPVAYDVAPISLVATASSGLVVSFNIVSGPATVSGSTLTITGVGTVIVAANQAGSTTYAAAPQVTQSIVVNQAAQTINFTAPTTPVSYGVSPVTLAATASSGLAVSFNVVSGPASLSGSTLTITGAGTVVVAADQAGNANYAAATQVTRSIVVNKAAQTITFTSPASPVIYGVSPVALSATAISGEAVAFSVVSGPATLSGSVLTITGAGTVVVAANQAGNANYSAAPQVTQSIFVNKAAQTVTFTPPTTPVTYGVGPISLSANASSGDTVAFSVVSGQATVSGATLTITGAGTVVVAANQAGDSNYSAATQVTESIVVNKATQTITFMPPATPVTFGVSPISLSATANSGQAVTFSIASGPATIHGSTLTVTGAGTIIVAANQPGNANYLAATPVTETIVVNKATQTLSFPAPASPVTFGVAPMALTASATSGLAVSYSVLSGPATVSGSTLTFTGAGAIIVAADQSGNANYSAAAQVTQTVVVNKAAQKITFVAPHTPVNFGIGPIALSATSNSGLSVVFHVISGPATLSGSTLTITGAGTVAVAANQPGNANFTAATQISRSLLVNKSAQSISFTAPPATILYGAKPLTLIASASSRLPIDFVVLSGPAKVSGPTLSFTGVGVITVAATQVGNSNYNAGVMVKHIVTVKKATQSITFPDFSRAFTYGTPHISLGATATSKLAVAFKVVSGPGRISGSSLTVVGAGTVVIGANQLGNNFYSAAAQVSRSIVINKAALTVTADNRTKLYGAIMPKLNYTFTGLVNGEAQTQLIKGVPTLSTTATVSSSAGLYPINIAVGSLAAANYKFAFVNAILKINKAQAVLLAASKKKVYGTANPALTYTVSGLVKGDTTATAFKGLPTLSTPTQITSPVGTYSITLSPGTLTAANYTLVFSPGKMVVDRAQLKVTAQNQSMKKSAAVPSLTYAITGFVGSDTQGTATTGQPQLSTVATSTSPAGSYAIHLSIGTLAAKNYSFLPFNGKLTVTP